jgi:hypothetical protein
MIKALNNNLCIAGKKFCLQHQSYIGNPAIDVLSILAIVVLGYFFEHSISLRPKYRDDVLPELRLLPQSLDSGG